MLIAPAVYDKDCSKLTSSIHNHLIQYQMEVRIRLWWKA